MGIDPDDLDRRLKRLFRPGGKPAVPAPTDPKAKWVTPDLASAKRYLHIALRVVPVILLVIGVIAVITGSA
ncbi:MAG: hypothetical protein ACYCS7_11365 [Acidimicrobiales bacterium]